MIVVYDFDKTLTQKDTLFDFFKFNNKKKFLFFLKTLIYFSSMVLTKFKLISNDTLKNIGIKLFLKNLNEEEINYKFFNYYKTIKYNFLFNQTDFKTIDKCYIISASFENYLKPIFPQNVEIIGSTINKDNSNLTFNCYAKNKIIALKKLGIDEIDIFYTDSLSDLPLVKLSKKTILVKNDKLIECNTVEDFIRNVK